MFTEPTNDERAEWAQVALNAFAKETRMDTAGEDDATVLGDLLTNLMHWCDRNGVDFDTKLTGAVVNYETETSA
jgi:hypothetical protein